MLSALGQPTRLEIFRLLTREHDNGLAAGEIGRTLGVPASTLSAHLSQMEGCGLLYSRRSHRQVIYYVNQAFVRQFFTFLTEDCCYGRPELCGWQYHPRTLSSSTPLDPESYMDANQPLNVLFLCTGNSARSIMGEAIMNKFAMGRYKAYSAGSDPKGEINPLTIRVLESEGHRTDEFKSKSWDQFLELKTEFSFVFTVCDSVKEQGCPTFPGQLLTAHWALPDPAAVTGTDTEKMAAFREVYGMMYRRIDIFLNLPIRALESKALQAELDNIGKQK